jgi:hypothetical protein
VQENRNAIHPRDRDWKLIGDSRRRPVEPTDMIGGQNSFRNIVRHIQCRPSFLSPEGQERLEQFMTKLHVETLERLIQQDEFRRIGECPGDRDR